MVKIAEPYIAIFEMKDGYLTYMSEGYELKDLGGTIPNVGDLMVDPGVLDGADRREASSHTVREVVARYIKPQISDVVGARIALVVKSRRGKEEEANLLFA